MSAGLLKDGKDAFGLDVIALMLVSALAAPWLAPHDPLEQDLLNAFQAPLWKGGDASHALGTDSLGRDILSRLIHGTRLSLLIGTISVAISLTLGTILGLVAGYFRGIVDTAIMRLMDVMLALPSLLLTHPQSRKHPLLYLRIVDSDAAAGAFVAVDHQVVRLRSYRPRGRLQFVEILVHRRRKRMVVGHPALLLLVPEERRKIDDPEDLEIPRGRIEQAERGCQMNAQVPQCLTHNIFLVGDENEQVASLGLHPLSQFLLHRGGQELLDRRR